MSSEPYKSYLKSFDSTQIVTDAPRKFTFFRALAAVSALSVLISVPFVIIISIIALTISVFQ